jgi:ElaB/YqjD/DUF883 family membrane-anchored ribosome-binding protein
MTEKSAATTLTDDVKQLLHEAEQALAHTGDDANEKVDELRERLRTVIDDGSHSFARLRREAIRRTKQADELVRENPYYAIGIAAGVGALLGFLISRRGGSAR